VERLDRIYRSYSLEDAFWDLKKKKKKEKKKKKKKKEEETRQKIV